MFFIQNFNSTLSFKYAIIFESFNLTSSEFFYFSKFLPLFDLFVIKDSSLNTSSFNSFFKILFLKNFNNLKFFISIIKLKTNFLSSNFFFNSFFFKELNLISINSFFLNFFFKFLFSFNLFIQKIFNDRATIN